MPMNTMEIDRAEEDRNRCLGPLHRWRDEGKNLVVWREAVEKGRNTIDHLYEQGEKKYNLIEGKI